jgi:6-phosphogluconolactonase
VDQLDSAGTRDRPRLAIYPTPDFARLAAGCLAGILRHAAARRGVATAALAGGETPRPVYRALAEESLPWHRLELYFGDERALPPSDPGSNFRMFREAFLDQVPPARVRVHRIVVEGGDLDLVAAQYARILPDRLDLLLLGMGDDGHTASLFPGSAALAATERVVAVKGPRAPHERITITPPVIAAAREVVVLVTGEQKAALVARVLRGPVDENQFPVQMARHGLWLLDAAAARDLTE